MELDYVDVGRSIAWSTRCDVQCAVVIKAVFRSKSINLGRH